MDPVPGGSASAYDYGYANPLSNFDLTGDSSARHCGYVCSLIFWGLAKVIGNIMGDYCGIAYDLCSALGSALVYLAQYLYECLGRCYSFWKAVSVFVMSFAESLGMSQVGARGKMTKYGSKLMHLVEKAKAPVTKIIGSGGWSTIMRLMYDVGL